jgi:hypothetical protein
MGGLTVGFSVILVILKGLDRYLVFNIYVDGFEVIQGSDGVEKSLFYNMELHVLNLYLFL